MAYEFHFNKEVFFQYQFENSKDYIIPFIKDFVKIQEDTTVLEIGSAEAGILKSFTDIGCKCIGIELSESRVQTAKKFMSNEISSGKIDFINKDIHLVDPEKELPFKFDLIIVKDVIEHVYEQEKMIRKLKEFLRPNGKIFFGLPPWCMPFGGHQQLCDNKFLHKLPYFHLLPMTLYKAVLKAFHEPAIKIKNQVEIKETQISINRFERIAKSSGFEIVNRQFYFINPLYKYKFKLKPRKLSKIIGLIPFARDFFTTTAYYLIAPL